MRVLLLILFWVLCSSVHGQIKPEERRFADFSARYYTDFGSGLEIVYREFKQKPDTVRIAVHQYTEFNASPLETVIYVSLLTGLDCDCHQFYGRPTLYGNTHKVVVCSTKNYNIVYVSLFSLHSKVDTEFYTRLKNGTLQHRGIKTIKPNE